MECITDDTMEDDVGNRDFNNLNWQRMNLIDGSISIYCYIINSPERLNMIKKPNELTAVIGYIESERLGER